MITSACFTLASALCWLSGNPLCGAALAVLALYAYRDADGLSPEEVLD